MPAALAVLVGTAMAQSNLTSVSIPQHFIEDGSRFVLLGTHAAAALETDRINWIVTDADGLRAGVLIEPVAARSGVAPLGDERLPGVVSRFHGQPSEWTTSQPTWRRVAYQNLWDGIDLVLEADGQTCKSTYVIAPGADPCRVIMRHRGAKAVSIDADGNLVIDTAAGPLVDAAPFAWQQVEGERRTIHAAFTLSALSGGDVDVGYDLGPHDAALPLFIDPAVVVQAGFIGGAERDEAADVAVGDDGSVYVCGWARSSETSFPVLVGPDLTWAGAFSPWGDAFVAKLDPTGNTLLYCGYIGGWDAEFAVGIAVDGLGRAYVGGHTSSSPAEGFPVLGGPDLTLGSSMDGWIARVSADGTALEYCGYVGGQGFEDRVLDVDVDALGRAYLVGHTDSDHFSFPVSVGPDLVENGSTDAWVARVAADGLSLEFCGYVGGSAGDECTSVVADGAGGAWIAGWTASDETTFPVSIGPDLTYNGNTDQYVARVSPTGASLLFCGYVGGTNSDLLNGLAVDPGGNLYLAGHTWSTDFPALVGPDLTANGLIDGTVTKVAAGGTGLVWSGYIGGTFIDFSFGIAVDATGGVWVTGSTSSDETSFPASGGPDDTANGSTDGFVARVLPSGAGLDFSGFVGGSGFDQCNGIALVPAILTPGVTEAWLAGYSTSSEATFPVVTGPDVSANGAEDATVVRVQAAPNPWQDLGNGLAGTHGIPFADGVGTLVANTPVTLSLDTALENTTAYLVVSPLTLYAPFKGGVLVPDPGPPGFYIALLTSPTGQAFLASTWPPGFPSGFSIYVQWWIADPAGVVGFAASNAISGTTP